MVPTEDRFIAILSRTSLSTDRETHLEALLRMPLDWESIFKKARKEKVSSLLYLHIAKFKQYAPARILGEFERIYYTDLARNALILEEAEKISALFNGKGIRSIPMKGVFLAENIYKNIALRPMSDIDILIRKYDLQGADEALRSIGYITPPSYGDLLKNSRGSYVNSLMYRAADTARPFAHIHWHLVNSTWPIGFLADMIDMDRIWSRAGSGRIGVVDTSVLSPEHLLIYLCQHAFNHNFDRMILSSDILEALGCYEALLDWDALASEARMSGLDLVVFCALLFISNALDINIHETEKVKPLRMGLPERLVSSYAAKGKCSYGLSYLTYLIMEKGAYNKAQFINKTLFPPPHVMGHDLNIPSSEVKFSHYFRRIAGNTIGAR